MKFIKFLLCNYLSIGSLFNINKRGISKFKKNIPKNYCSFKKTKQYYFDNNIYYDIYQESLFDLDNTKKEYNKFNILTAEHMVPQSRLKLIPNAKFDMHNIFLTTACLNNYRSNYKYIDEQKYLICKDDKKYLNLSNELLFYDPYKNYKNNKLKIFIPYLESRGIISRSIAYMKITYPELIIEKIIDLEILIKWNNQYPPTEIEKKQNEIINSIQGNYNPFIFNNHNIENYLYP